MEGVNLAAGDFSGIGMIGLKQLHVGTRPIPHAIKEIAADVFPGLQFQGHIAPVPKSQFNDSAQLLLGVWTKHGSLETSIRRLCKSILRHGHRDS